MSPAWTDPAGLFLFGTSDEAADELRADDQSEAAKQIGSTI